MANLKILFLLLASCNCHVNLAIIQMTTKTILTFKEKVDWISKTTLEGATVHSVEAWYDTSFVNGIDKIYADQMPLIFTKPTQLLCWIRHVWYREPSIKIVRKQFLGCATIPAAAQPLNPVIVVMLSPISTFTRGLLTKTLEIQYLGKWSNFFTR